MIRQNDSKLYRLFLINFIMQLLLFLFIYLLFVNEKPNPGVSRWLLTGILMVIFIYTNFIVYYLMKKTFTFQRLLERQKLELVKYKYLENDLQVHRQHHHDTKNHLMIISELVKSRDYEDLENYTKQFSASTNRKLMHVNTGLDELDVLFYNKIDQAKKQHIKVDFNCGVGIDADENAVLDLISIASNLFDNAIEANLKIQDINDRIISINIDQDQLDYIFIITNTFVFDRTILRKPVHEGYTTKADKKNHGLGLKIVTRLVNKYDGKMSYKIYNDLFYEVRVELPKHTL